MVHAYRYARTTLTLSFVAGTDHSPAGDWSRIATINEEFDDPRSFATTPAWSGPQSRVTQPLVVHPGVVRVINRPVEAMFDQWPHTEIAEFVTESGRIIAVVGGEAIDLDARFVERDFVRRTAASRFSIGFLPPVMDRRACSRHTEAFEREHRIRK
jgi:hypothetical protein